MWFEDYQWHYDYVRLAWDTGFAFDKCKSANLDKNKICIVDVDRIVKERDVASVDRYISTVVQYILDDEQAKVLDTNFVKIFRISQLAVEYLLFCKKYLDNTVTLLKKELTKNKEENTELKLYVEDLQGHVETLTKQQVFASFKCSLCSKVFGSEDYLNAHIKRRHNNQNLESSNFETDRLNMEIKELKERLNNTEKLLKEKEEQSTEKNNNINENSNMLELLKKFDSFKNQVEDELKELKRQKSFYEENYSKLFNIVVQNKENIEPKTQMEKTETTTQTDKVLHLENVQNKNVLEVQEQSDQQNHEEQNIVEAKISATLAGIEGQMQAFWNRLSDIEQNKTNDTIQTKDNDNIEIKEVKPRAKPRSKWTKPTRNSVIVAENIETRETLINAIKELQDKQKKEDIVAKDVSEKSLKRTKSVIIEKVSSEEESESEEESQSESESEESESEESEEPIKKPAEVLVKESKAKLSVRTPEYSPSSAKVIKEKVKEKPSVSNNLDKQTHSRRSNDSNKSVIDINKQVEEMVYHRLQDLGISDNWKGLPQRSFDRALEIINHQATLTKKTFPNFTSIKKKIKNIINKKCDEKMNNKTQLEVKRSGTKSNIEKLQNIVRIGYRPKSSMRNSPNHKSPKREINPALYDTDSESENIVKQNSHKTNLYSNVVAELKSLSKKPSSDDESLEEAKKGVLKSFPSVVSLSKKKVLFDLASESSKLQEVLFQKQGGSTTSIASSILGEKVTDKSQDVEDKEKINSKKVEKDLDLMSDFDLSDLE